MSNLVTGKKIVSITSGKKCNLRDFKQYLVSMTVETFKHPRDRKVIIKLYIIKLREMMHT